MGIRVFLSNNHNCKGVPAGAYFDVCDELAGDYPKDFKFVGWHPHCRCHADSIIKTDDELARDRERIARGEEPLAESESTVRELPENFTKWLDKNKGRIERAKNKPYFLTDNERLIKRREWLRQAAERHERRTPEDVARIQSAWNARKAASTQGRIDALQQRVGALTLTKEQKEYLSGFVQGGDLDLAARHIGWLEDAAARHAARTQAHIDAVLEMRAERKAALDLAKQLGLSDAPGVAEVLKTATAAEAKALAAQIQKAIAAREAALDLAAKLDGATAIQAADLTGAKTLAEVRKLAADLQRALDEINQLTHLDDALAVAKQFGLAEAKAVEKAVAGKLAQLKAKYPDIYEYRKWIDFELNYVVKHKKYVTWEAAMKAYQKELAAVDLKIKYKELTDKFTLYGNLPSKAKAYIAAKTEAFKANLAGDIPRLEKAIAALEKEYNKLQKAAAKKAAKNAGAAFDADAYTQARKDAALWTTKKDAYGFYDRTPGDKHFRPTAEADWKRWNDNEKDVAYLYTSGSCYINEPTYTKYIGTKYGLFGEVRDSWKDINTLTDMIDKSVPFSRDVWLNRGVSSAGEFFGQFGVNLSDYERNPGGLVGLVGEQKPFLSTGHTKSWGFVDDGGKPTAPIVYNIYCPKGTKGIYTEPYSAYGKLGFSKNGRTNGGRGWDGHSDYGCAKECEVILQRGTRLRITKAYKKGYQWFVDMEVVGQPPKMPNVP